MADHSLWWNEVEPQETRNTPPFQTPSRVTLLPERCFQTAMLCNIDIG